MKKIFTLFALVAMTLSMTAQTVYTDATTGLNFVITGENTAKIVAGDYSAMDDLEFSTVKQGTTTYKVTEIGDRVFKNCKYLVIFAMEDDNTPVTIGEEAFAGCESLETCIISNCQEIKKKAFVGCSVFEGDGPMMVKIVGDSAFAGCPQFQIQSLTYNCRKTLTSIGAYAFEGTKVGVSNHIYLGDGQDMHIGENAFKSVTGAEEVWCGFKSLTYDGDKSPLDDIKDQIIKVRLLSTLEAIPAKFFAGVSNAIFNTIQGITISVDDVSLDNLKTIGDSAFAGCTTLSNVSINHIFGSSLTTIGADAFNGCSAVTTFVLPASLTTIGDRAFAGLSNLSQITANMTTPPAINANVFNDCGDISKITLKVDDANYDTYNAANVWKNFKLQRQSGLWAITFDGHDINKATIKVLNSANDEVLDESQITDGTTVKFEITPAPGYINKQTPEPMVITGDEYIAIDLYAIVYRHRCVALGGHGSFVYKKNGVDFVPEIIGSNYSEYEYGTQLEVTVVPAAGYRFVKWRSGASNNNPTQYISFVKSITSPNAARFRSNFTYLDYFSDLEAEFEVDPATGVDNIATEGKAVKRFINGQMVIEKNGKLYNALGAEIR
ncbi:MAG: leucine-rich repeat domain-containing protein [Paludibacteraceae bacterium]|nr:leucine-rich repeat domain-containing protein [Paludibacteraceae bacterium]